MRALYHDRAGFPGCFFAAVDLNASYQAIRHPRAYLLSREVSNNQQGLAVNLFSCVLHSELSRTGIMRFAMQSLMFLQMRECNEGWYCRTPVIVFRPKLT